MKAESQHLKVKFLQFLETEKRYSKHTVENYSKDIDDLEKFCCIKKINAWDPIRITDVLIIVETFSQDDDVPQIITALLNQFSDKLLVHYDGCFEDSGNSVFSDLHFCSITPSEQQF